MDHNDQRDFAEEDYNRAEMEREGLEELEADRKEAFEGAELFAAILTQQANDRNYTTNALIQGHEDTIVKLLRELQRVVTAINIAYDSPYAPNPAILMDATHGAQVLLNVYRDKLDDWRRIDE